MRIGVDVGGTNTDAVLMDGTDVVAAAKQPTTADVKSGIMVAIGDVLAQAQLGPATVTAVMIGTTQFANALVERSGLDKVGMLRLASPSGEALPPLTGWPDDLAGQVGNNVFLLPGGYEVDGSEISALDEESIRAAGNTCRERGIRSIAISSVFAPMNAAMEERATRIVLDTYPEAVVSLSSSVGRLGIVERENSVILNAALASLARHVTASFRQALDALHIAAPLYVSQNDGTLITAAEAARYPVLTIGSGPTNSMRGAAFLTGLREGVVMDVGGTTCDIGALSNGFPRESAVAVDIGGVRTNFRMPDILSIGLGGGTRIHIDPSARGTKSPAGTGLRVGPDSVGYRITSESRVFGGDTLTATDVAVATGRVKLGNPALLPALRPGMRREIWSRLQAMLSEGLDRMKTAPGGATIIAVGGGSFLVGDTLKGAADVLRPRHADVANAIGAAIAQIGAQVERIINYDTKPRDKALADLREEAAARAISAGGRPESIEIVELDEVFLSYLPGRSARIRIKAVGDLEEIAPTPAASGPGNVAGVRHAH